MHAWTMRVLFKLWLICIIDVCKVDNTAAVIYLRIIMFALVISNKLSCMAIFLIQLHAPGNIIFNLHVCMYICSMSYELHLSRFYK